MDVVEDDNIHTGHISLGECHERLINSSSSLRLWARAETHSQYISLCGCHERLSHFSSSLKVSLRTGTNTKGGMYQYMNSEFLTILRLQILIHGGIYLYASFYRAKY